MLATESLWSDSVRSTFLERVYKTSFNPHKRMVLKRIIFKPIDRFLRGLEEPVRSATTLSSRHFEVYVQHALRLAAAYSLTELSEVERTELEHQGIAAEVHGEVNRYKQWVREVEALRPLQAVHPEWLHVYVSTPLWIDSEPDDHIGRYDFRTGWLDGARIWHNHPGGGVTFSLVKDVEYFIAAPVVVT